MAQSLLELKGAKKESQAEEKPSQRVNHQMSAEGGKRLSGKGDCKSANVSKDERKNIKK